MRHDLERLTTAAGMRAHGRTWKTIAETLGVNERTARRWADLPEFKAEVERVRGDLTPTPRGSSLLRSRRGRMTVSTGKLGFEPPTR
jgi:hypothetical protein